MKLRKKHIKEVDNLHKFGNDAFNALPSDMNSF